MKKIIIPLLVAGWAIGSVSAQRRGYIDDLYIGSTRQSRTVQKERREIQRSARATAAEQRKADRMPAQWTPARQPANGYNSTGMTAQTQRDELVTSVDAALQRRILAYRNYRAMDDDYWRLMESFHEALSRRYDPAFYNVITFGNDMWVEPAYITAIFDKSDPTARLKEKQFSLWDDRDNRTQVNVTLNVTPGGGWFSPWNAYWDSYYWGYAPWRNPWRWNSYYYGGWGPHWGWNWSWNWGPTWGWGPAWGPNWSWGPAWWPGYAPLPPAWGGGSGGGGHRPVIWGDGRPGNGPTYRPGQSGGTTGRPVYSGGYRRNDNGTGVAINHNGGSGNVNRRPSTTGTPNVSIRPGGSNNQYSPIIIQRPASEGNDSYRPSVDRSYRRDVGATPAPAQRQQPSSVQRSEPVRNTTPSVSPSRPSSGSYGGSSGNYGGGGGGYRRR